jgi:aminomethyltransferase
VSEDLQDTPLTARHESAGAKLAPFAGWRLPLQFEGTLAEHTAVREDVGVFDVSHLGTVWVTGPDATAVIADTFTNDPWKLADGESQYTLHCDAYGGIVDDLIVARISADRWMAVPNAANRLEVVRDLKVAAAERTADVHDETSRWAVIAVQGPRALDVARAVLGFDAGSLAFTHIAPVEHDGVSLLVSRTGYTGERGVELVVPDEAAVRVWDACLEAGARPCGLGARDTLRLEMGYPLHGNDLTREVLPLEARLGWAVRLDRPGEPQAAAALRASREVGPRRRLLGLRGDTRRAPRAGMTVLHDGAGVGSVTSGSYSPVLGVGIGLALLDDPVAPGDTVAVDVRGREQEFAVVKPPFVDRDPH